jgi:transcriptional regulator
VYIPRSFDCDDSVVIRNLLEKHSFGVLVTTTASGQALASHLPFLPCFDATGKLVCLRGHLARANPQVDDLATQAEILTIFQGPHAYVSPRHYDTGFAVPTWNYAVIHAYGCVQIHDDDDVTRGLLDDLVDVYESGPTGWRADWHDERSQGLLKAIVSFDIQVLRVEAKFKLNQNRPEADQRSAAAALLDSDRGSDQETGQLMLDLLDSSV